MFEIKVNRTEMALLIAMSYEKAQKDGEYQEVALSLFHTVMTAAENGAK